MEAWCLWCSVSISSVSAVSCPNLAAASIPACSSFSLYYKLIPPYFSDDSQTILDSSGNGFDGINGDNGSDGVNDATM